MPRGHHASGGDATRIDGAPDETRFVRATAEALDENVVRESERCAERERTLEK